MIRLFNVASRGQARFCTETVERKPLHVKDKGGASPRGKGVGSYRTSLTTEGDWVVLSVVLRPGNPESGQTETVVQQLILSRHATEQAAEAEARRLMLPPPLKIFRRIEVDDDGV